MKELTSTQPMTDAEYEAEADRLVRAAQENLLAMQNSQQRIERMRLDTDATIKDIFRTLDRIAEGRDSAKG